MPSATLNDFTKVSQEEFARKLKKLWASQLKEFKAIVGKPPDFKRVKAAHWDKWKKEQEAALLLLMVGTSMLSLRSQVNDWQNTVPDGIEQTDIERRYLRDARQRASIAAQRITTTTKRKLRTLYRKTTPEDEIEESVDSVFGRSRAETVAVTETTAGKAGSVIAIQESMLARGIACQLIWSMGPCNHCEECPKLHGTPYSVWSMVSTGPPLHVGCCCQLIIRLG